MPTTNYIADSSKEEAWQRVSSTQLRKKIVSMYTRVFVGYSSREDAEQELDDRIAMYENVHGGHTYHIGGGMWGMKYTFKTAEWVDPPVYKDG